jgi:hypothetical protein
MIVNSDGVLTLIPQPDFVVHGVIWSIHQVELIGLDVVQGMPGVCDRYGSFARGPGNELISSDYYAARNRKLGRAAPGYIKVIVEEGQRRGFPQTYLDEIAAWTHDRVLHPPVLAS